jgi:hypothetical protein
MLVIRLFAVVAAMLFTTAVIISSETSANAKPFSAAALNGKTSVMPKPCGGGRFTC